MRLLASIVLFSFLASPLLAQNIDIINAFPNLDIGAIMDIESAPDGTDRLFISEKGGALKVLALDSQASNAPIFLNLRNKVVSTGDWGLQSVAFHPNYASNGYVFVYYTAPDPNRSVISRFKRSQSDPDKADLNSEVVLLELNQPATNHNGGKIFFGPDGYLYIPFGDGGGAGDPYDNGQDLTTFHSTILRIDVDNPSGGKNYGIPAGNPFVGNSDGFREEIYAYGLREPWRSSVGPMGKIWVADVGQNQREEINWIELGKNYGWSVTEGNLCYSPSAGCSWNGIEPPIWEYNRTEGTSITGGFVYTNENDGCGSLVGKYIYADYVKNVVWAISYDQNGVLGNEVLTTNAGIKISTFGTDRHGTIYMANFGSDGSIHKFACSDDPLPVELTSFDGLVDGDRVHLSWHTASELNNAGFEVQHKRAGDALFETAAFVPGAGTTDEAQSYAYTLESLSAGIHIFRLKQIDFDGTTAFSDEVEVWIGIDQPYEASALHPNPFNPTTQFSLVVQSTQRVRIDVYDLTGRHVERLFDNPLMAGEEHRITWEAGAVPSGVYYIRIAGENFQASRRAVLVK